MGFCMLGLYDFYSIFVIGFVGRLFGVRFSRVFFERCRGVVGSFFFVWSCDFCFCKRRSFIGFWF